jgi:hypothetical protein
MKITMYKCFSYKIFGTLCSVDKPGENMEMNRLARHLITVAAVVAAASLTGCASIVGGTSQIVSVETLQPAGKVVGASCKLENDKGVWYVSTPGTVTVHRAYGDMMVKCEKDGVAPGVATVKSSTKAMLAGNLLFGGPIGAGVDAASGAAYDYPALFQIMMGNTITIPAATTAPAGAPAAAAGSAMQ